ncbi:MAG: amidohydrolase [Flavobacteriales bacterium]
MADVLSITLVQSPLVWENPEANRLYFEKVLDRVKKTDLILLPEMFTSGFTMNPKKVAETMQGETVRWMTVMAKKKKSVICGSAVITENKKYYNRFIWVSPTGEIFTYDKRHLFRMANEHNHYTAGTEKIIIHYKAWKICPMVCYDLRFPVWSRNKNNEYDLLLYTANWPKPRIEAWSKLLEARAIENQCYVLGVNRTGKDAMKKEYTGHSAVIDPKGKKISKTKPNTASVETVNISLKELNDYRKKFPLANDADEFDMRTAI